MQVNFREENIMTENQISLRWFERQLSKLDRRMRKAEEKGRLAEVEDIRVRMRHFRVAVRAIRMVETLDRKDGWEG